MAMFIVEHHAFSIMNHFPVSHTAVHFTSKRTKTKCIIKNACAPHFHDELKAKLKAGYFSVIIDETTDISETKELFVKIKVSLSTDLPYALYFTQHISICVKSFLKLLKSFSEIFITSHMDQSEYRVVQVCSCTTTQTPLPLTNSLVNDLMVSMC